MLLVTRFSHQIIVAAFPQPQMDDKAAAQLMTLTESVLESALFALLLMWMHNRQTTRRI